MLRLLSRKNFGRAQEKWWLSVPEGAGSGYFPPDGDGAKCEEIREVVERTLFSDLLEPSGDMLPAVWPWVIIGNFPAICKGCVDVAIKRVIFVEFPHISFSLEGSE